jgi:hypothetical protein
MTCRGSIVVGLVATLPAIVACSAKCPPPQTPGAGSAAEAPPQGSAAAPQSGAYSATGTPVASNSEAAGPPPEPPPGAQSLPEVRLLNVGLHVGGGSNDEAEKEPFKRAIESRFDDFLRCYRMVHEPEKGGTFGVDLFIGRGGGKPEVRQPRTAMGGTEFRDCMVSAFSSVSFERPKAGPTVISYSLRFELGS